MYGGSDETCVLCNKAVYMAERVSTDGKIYHNNCFRCRTCNKKLALGTYAQIDGTLFCKPHFDAQFHAAGRYEVVSAASAPVLRNIENMDPRGGAWHRGGGDWTPSKLGDGDRLGMYLEYLIERLGEQQKHMNELRGAIEDLRDAIEFQRNDDA